MHLGMFTGKKLSDYIKGQFADYKEARRIINGTDKANLLAKYASRFEKILRNSISAATPSTSLTDTQGESNPAGTRNPAQPATDGPADGSPLNNSPMVGEQNAEQIINNEAEKQPPPTGKETVIKERPSLFTRVVTAVGGFFTMILASIAATCGGNEVANVVAKQGAERIVENTSRSDLYTLALVVVYIALILASATLMLWIISKFYGRSADRANSLNHAKVETASDPAKNTVELKL
jgi:hypothetical protein